VKKKYSDPLTDWSGRPGEVFELTAMPDRMVSRLLA